MSGDTWDVVGIGENSIDEIYRLPELPSANVKIQIASRRLSPGGQVATTMCACARLGLRASYVGAFGNDESSAHVRAALAGHGVATGDSVVRNAPTRRALILVDGRSGERAVLWQRDAALAMAADELRSGMLTGARLLHVDATDAPFSIAAARAARQSGILVTSDIDDATGPVRELIDLVDVAILAEGVPRALTGEADVETALKRLRERHRALLCVTQGDRGAILLDGNRLHRSPAFRVNAIDTTGAGDVFRAGFIYALLRGDEPPQILRFANAAAAVSCTREGAIDSVPSLEEVEKLATA